MARVLAVVLIFLALCYSLGWYRVRKDLPNSVWRLAAFIIGLTSIAAVWATPLAHLDHHSLTAHMLQHLVLMTIAAPLLLLAQPRSVLLGSLPRPFSDPSAQVLELAPIRSLRSIFAHPIFCWLAGTGCVILWHVPALFELGMRSEWWHGFEQITFLAAGLLFWWPVIRQRSATKRPRWSITLYLFLATLPCDALSAFLTFCGRVVYPSYLSGPGMFDTSALRDQEFAGAMMWVWVTFIYLVPAVIITIEGLSAHEPVRLEYDHRAIRLD
jgi:cytochrome c oxidase assembly factor CtaG